MFAVFAKFVQRYGFSVNCRKNVPKRQRKVTILHAFKMTIVQIIVRKLPILCNKYAVLHKKVCFLCNRMCKLNKKLYFCQRNKKKEHEDYPSESTKRA